MGFSIRAALTLRIRKRDAAIPDIFQRALQRGLAMRRMGLMVMVVLALPGAEALAGIQRAQTATAAPEQCLKIVRDYVKRTRGWDASTYMVEGESVGSPGRGFSVMLLAEMGVLLPPGGGQSFHVDTDRECSRVVGELAYQ